ncbi:uncharacterized protein LOC130636052 [Hydractinia symbiolongicarpus]|uniref:uncharacterized protein LOC130636052 n=1 Tax=Hydractinia symbiolongicarpus TaxID=13093 RepID=UPI0025516966|nr:uncharacterized protein LOC130636052 [Hydractinia symbiolongicarpus]
MEKLSRNAGYLFNKTVLDNHKYRAYVTTTTDSTVSHPLMARKNFLMIGGFLLSAICAVGILFMLVTHFLSKRSWRRQKAKYRARGLELPRMLGKEVTLPLYQTKRFRKTKL